MRLSVVQTMLYVLAPPVDPLRSGRLRKAFVSERLVADPGLRAEASSGIVDAQRFAS